jgi:subtilisin-like proprotein convertase family protein
MRIGTGCCVFGMFVVAMLLARPTAAAQAVPAAPHAAPTPPAGMVLSQTSVVQTTPVPIATGPVVVSSSLQVSGAGPYLWDLDLTTNLTHTFAADLDITIQSPAGTIVTLTTDNGAGHDDVFDGARWDDQANPAGAVPYTSNDGLVTDHAYQDLTTATPLVPEEALGAFRGENPNGQWTLTISDDFEGDGGALASWSLELFTLTAAPVETSLLATQDAPTAIPSGPAVASSSLGVSGAGSTLTALAVTTQLTHSFAADLDITLRSPAGTVVTLTSDNGTGRDDVFAGTLWSDDASPGGQVPYLFNAGLATDHPYVDQETASPLAPEEALSAFVGENPNGTWTLTISDDLAGNGGSLDAWQLQLTTGVAPCQQLICPPSVSVPAALDQCGAVVTFVATADAACGAVTCTPASGGLFPVGTTMSTCTTAVGGLSCSFTVTVNDTQPPSITCPADVTQPQLPGVPTLVVNYPAPTVNDNCPGASAACAPPSGSAFPVGTTNTTCTATDGATNTATCSFNVAVGPFRPDTPIPTLSLAGVILLALMVIALSRNAQRG